ncbi:MAG TPA: transposase, partial [Propionibacteriaceae bacterium]
MFAESRDDEQIIERVAALDIGKAEIVCCIRLPAADGERRAQEVSTHSTMVTSLCELANRLVGLGIERVVMEATSDYWRPPFYLFEAHGLDPWLVNAKHVKHLPGRPKTDRLDAVWLCKVAERQMLRPSFVPPADIRQLRDLTRYRIDLVGVRTAEKNRVDKLLELSRSGARCPDCSGPFPQTARRTRRAPLGATGSPRSLPLCGRQRPRG